uniref:GCN5-like N-acetyltransferase n=1 Tax=Rhodospora sordida TaxID=362230 RepID=UPI001FCCF991|nr:GCN5-like N-acetyltransferase [Rhodospora sordida]UNJ14909.1 GCN5-like N-acetyltransferase [Rhodospora sordida]
MNSWIKFFKQSTIIKIYKQYPQPIYSYKILLLDGECSFFIRLSNTINLYELENLCSLVGWVRRPTQKVKRALDNSFLNLTLYLEHNQNKKLIGFVRAISDSAFNATIWDMVIHPEYQNQGLGTILMRKIIQELRYLEIDTVTLFADTKNVKFYNKLGFIADPRDIKGMFWYPQ